MPVIYDGPMTYSITRPPRGASTRAVEAFRAVTPSATETQFVADRGGIVEVKVAGHRLRLGWAGEGWTGDVRPLLQSPTSVDVVAARRLSPGARAVLDDAGIGWVDELGNAEISIGSLVISRTGRLEVTPVRPPRWTPAFVSVAEAILCGIEATVSATAVATGLSTGTCTNALRTLTDLGLLETDMRRGRGSGRRVIDDEALLSAYADAATALASPDQVTVGVTWRDPIGGLADLAPRLLSRNIQWAATGAVAAALMAPLLTNFGTTVVYIDAPTVPALERVARSVDLKPIEGGRLVLRPSPFGWTHNNRKLIDGILVAPWPRVYVDLRTTGVRGEEAAEHLVEVCRDR